MSMFGKVKDQQDKRRFQVFTDQHGRKWGGTIELSTGDPTGLLDPQFRAPILPPPRYQKVNSQKAHGQMVIDYQGWAGMLRRANEAWEQQAIKVATAMYGDAAAEKLEQMPPALLASVGPRPEPVEPVLAAEHGDPWILGLTDVRPAWADLFFPKEKPKAKDLPDELAFLRHGQEATVHTKTGESGGYPVMYAPGRWRLSDGSTVQGKRADAEAAENGLIATSTSVGSPVHESWSAA